MLLKAERFLKMGRKTCRVGSYADKILMVFFHLNYSKKIAQTHFTTENWSGELILVNPINALLFECIHIISKIAINKI